MQPIAEDGNERGYTARCGTCDRQIDGNVLPSETVPQCEDCFERSSDAINACLASVDMQQMQQALPPFPNADAQSLQEEQTPPPDANAQSSLLVALQEHALDGEDDFFADFLQPYVCLRCNEEFVELAPLDGTQPICPMCR